MLSWRFFATQRAAGGGLCIFATALSTALLPNEAAIIAALAAAGKAAQYAQLTVTLLPSAPEQVAYHPTSAAAALALTRAFARAGSANGALAVTVHDVLTVIPHFPPFAYAIGTELGSDMVFLKMTTHTVLDY